MTKHASWNVSVGYLLGMAGVVLGLALVALGKVSAWWLLAWFVMHHFNTVMVSAGLHRYFSHGAYKVSRFWHNFMAIYSVTLLYGSPYAWATAHVTHHVYSDTDRDPHDTSWRYAILKRFRDVPMVMSRFKRIAGDPVLDFVHRHWFDLWMLFAVALLLISPTVFIYGYLMPLGTAHLFGVIHTLLSHKNGESRNLPWLEFIFPTGGEWHHRTHHDHSRRASFRTAWWHLDLGAVFIRLVRRA